MKRKKWLKLLLVGMIAALGANCGTVKGWFGKKNPGPDRPPEVMAEEGIKKLKGKKYDAAIETFEKVRDRYPYSDQALMAQIKVADAYFYKKKYDEALGAYKEFEKLHPTNKAVPYCVYRQALCYYRQRSTIDRDQSFTLKALQEFRRLKQKFPQCEYIPKADKYMAKCIQDLVEHEFYIAEFYYKNKRYQAALDRYQGLVQEHPNFPQKALAQARMEECQKILNTPEEKKGGIISKVTSIFDAKW
ncbi:MAG: outer membrane protein assembly factor BamD [Deltaproteobacteria bacterium]|nr:outer membrane protein assembly factor BamD [Deltaproteobacteria bacterium]